MADSFNDHGIQISIQGNKIVHVFRDDMEQNVDGVLKLLQVEVPSLDVWANFAIQYFQLGKNQVCGSHHLTLQSYCATYDSYTLS